MELRRLTAADAKAFREVRLHALRESPQAFSADYEINAAHPLQHFAAQLQDQPDNFVIGAFAGEALVGIGGFACEDQQPKLRHKGFIWSVYVLPEHRRGGLGRRIIEQVIGTVVASAPHVKQINITVTAINARAKELYVALGFKTWGREPRALYIEGDYYDDEHMLLILP